MFSFPHPKSSANEVVLVMFTFFSKKKNTNNLGKVISAKGELGNSKIVYMTL